ncbi:MAG TPA: hypothetical protein VIJ39_10295 [Solirubrobacteraceae bacterium]
MLVAVALAIAGCGGSGKTGSTDTSSTNAGSTGVTTATTTTGASSSPSTVHLGSGPPLAASQLVAKADSICARLNTELAAAKDVVQNQEDVVRVAAQRGALEQRAIAELSKLTPPSSIAKDYEQIVTARQALLEQTKKLGEEAAAGNVSAEAPVSAATTSVVREMGEAAQRSGFGACGTLG